jgi:hypothetical protein
VRDRILSVLKILFAEFQPGMGLEEIQAEYREKVYNSLIDYANSDRSIVAFRNQFRRAVNDAFTFTAYAGWVDGGGDGPIPPELQTWLNARIDQELKYVDEVFIKLKALRKLGDKKALEDFASARADGYSASLPGIYNQAKAWAVKDQWGTWRYGDTDHCDDCLSLNGKRHKLSWFIKYGWIPQSSNLKCTGRHCQCKILSDSGERLL